MNCSGFGKMQPRSAKAVVASSKPSLLSCWAYVNSWRLNFLNTIQTFMTTINRQIFIELLMTYTEIMHNFCQRYLIYA